MTYDHNEITINYQKYKSALRNHIAMHIHGRFAVILRLETDRLSLRPLTQMPFTRPSYEMIINFIQVQPTECKAMRIIREKTKK